MVAALDENQYNENDLVQIKLPLNIPYTTDWKDYERCDGNVVLNGIHYNYVKRKVSNDTMYLYCIPNRQKTELNHTKNEYAKQSADIPSGKKAENAVKKNGSSSEYNVYLSQYNFSKDFNLSIRTHLTNNNQTATGFIQHPVQPPDAVA